MDEGRKHQSMDAKKKNHVKGTSHKVPKSQISRGQKLRLLDRSGPVGQFDEKYSAGRLEAQKSFCEADV